MNSKTKKKSEALHGDSSQQQMLKMTVKARPGRERHKRTEAKKASEGEGRKNINTINTN